MLLGKRSIIPIVPGVMPDEDSTDLDSLLFSDMDKMRFQNGKLRNIGGCQRIFSNNDQVITGAARTLFSYRDINANPITIVGTNSRLYAIINNYFYNITPLSTNTTNIPNSLSTEYNAGAVVNVTTTNGSSVVTLNINHHFQNNDLLQISGVIGGPYNGIPAGNFNNTYPVLVVDQTHIQINVGALANVSGVVAVTMDWASAYVFVDFNNNNLPIGDRIKITGATDVGNILAASLNKEQIITNIVNSDQFVFETDTIATSKVTNGGGAATNIQIQIGEGNINQSWGYGYGGGLYGLGLYGTSRPFTNFTQSQAYPRIWSMDTFGGYLILTPGDPLTSTTDNLYIWKNNIATAPTLLSAEAGISGTSPLAVKWVYVSNSAVVALGSDGVQNQFFASSPGSFTNWNTASSNSLSTKTTIEQCGALISQSSSRNRDLIFTENDVYIAEFVEAPFVWVIRKLLTTDGLIGPKARVEIEDAVFWMGKGDFYVFDGTSVNVLPNNTVKRFVYDNIDFNNSHKVFAYPNVAYQEVSWFFVVNGENEPRNYVTYNYKERVWTKGTWLRSAAEEPINIMQTPLMIQSVIADTFVAPNSLSSYFFTLAANPLSTTNTSQDIVIALNPTCYLDVGDYLNISGAVDTNGIPAAEINGIKQITAISGGNVTIVSGTTSATSTGTGGGAAITVGTNILAITNPSQITIEEDDIIGILNADDVGGINADYINSPNIKIRYVAGNVLQFSVLNSQFTTSSVTLAGGTNTIMTINLDDDRLFQHESGLNDYNSNYVPGVDNPEDQYAPLNFFAETSYAQINEGDNTMLIYSVYPDSNQTQNVTVTVNGKLYAQSANVIQKGPYTITPTTVKFDVMLMARQRQYIIRSVGLNAKCLIGKWIEEAIESSPR